MAEVSNGEVDTSVAGFSLLLERYKLADFSQGIFKIIETLIIKTPEKSDGISYLTQFSNTTWLAIIGCLVFLVVLLALWFYILVVFGIEEPNPGLKNQEFAFVTSLNLCLRAFVKLAPEDILKSLTYKVILITTLALGFILFSYYEAILASTLIVESNNMPFNNWEDVVKSDKKVISWKGAPSEYYFRDAPSGSAKRQIYEEQMGYMKSYRGVIPGILEGDELVFEALASYEGYPEYPCQITSVDTWELR